MGTMGIAIAMGIYYWFARLRFGYTLSSALLQPATIGVFVGLLTGEMVLSMQIGAALQLVYLGVTSTPGGNVPNDPCLAGVIAIPLGVMSNMSPELAVALAVPFGVIGVFVDQLRRTTNAIWVHMADKYAEDANTAGIMRCAFVFLALMGFLIRFPFVFVIDLFGAEWANALIAALPDVLIHSFEVMGGILPALGFALTIMVIGKKELIPFFFLGYFAVAYLQIPVMGMAIFGLIIALVLRMILYPDTVNAQISSASAKTAETAKTGIITKKDVTKSFWIYYFGCELSNSYERLQSLVFCASMIPTLKKLYPAKEDLADALKRHLAFFNTEGSLGGIIQGISIAMEEEKATEKNLPGSAITSIKTGLMGPIAGMGDAIVWAVVMPIIYGVFIPFAEQGNALGGIAPLILWPGVSIVIQYFMTQRGYKLGRESITGLLQSGVMQSIIFAANVLGLIMMGALSSSYITISSPLEITSLAAEKIQDEAGRAIYRCRVTFDGSQPAGLSMEDVNGQLRSGDPVVWARTEFLNLGKIDFDPRPLNEGDKELIVKRLQEIMEG